MTSSRETERVYSFNPAARTGLGTEAILFCKLDAFPVTHSTASKQ